MKNLVILEGLKQVIIYRGKMERTVKIPNDKIYTHEQKRQFVRNLLGEDVAEQLLDYDILRISRKKEWANTKAVITNRDLFEADDDRAKVNMHKVVNPQKEALERADTIIKGINFAIKGKEDLVVPKPHRNKDVITHKEVKETRKIKKTPPKPLMPDGPVITLKDICEELGIDPSKARRILRKHEDEVKVTGKWEWNTEEHMDIISKVKDLIK